MACLMPCHMPLQLFLKTFLHLSQKCSYGEASSLVRKSSCRDVVYEHYEHFTFHIYNEVGFFKRIDVIYMRSYILNYKWSCKAKPQNKKGIFIEACKKENGELHERETGRWRKTFHKDNIYFSLEYKSKCLFFLARVVKDSDKEFQF